MKFFNNISDSLSKTKGKKRDAELEYPEEKILITQISKMLKTKNNKTISKISDWMGLINYPLILTDKRLICRDVDLLIEDITLVELVKVIKIFGKGQVLKISTGPNTYYQFCMYQNGEWLHQKVLPLSLKTEKREFQFSYYGMQFRIFGIILFFYLLWYVITSILNLLGFNF